MSASSRTTVQLLSEALEHLEAAETYASRDLTDQVVIDAIALRLSAGIEALGQLSDAERVGLLGDTWPAMRGMRNRIAHGYAGVAERYLVEVVRSDLPGLVAAVRHRRSELMES